jgi:hypothetical protein
MVIISFCNVSSVCRSDRQLDAESGTGVLWPDMLPSVSCISTAGRRKKMDGSSKGTGHVNDVFKTRTKQGWKGEKR